MTDDVLYQVLEQLSQSIWLTIPAECKEGVLKNTELLHHYSRLLHQFEIPEIKDKG